jgi:hypothetical protein
MSLVVADGAPVVLFQAHEVSAETLAAFAKLRSSAGKSYRVILLLDTKRGAHLPEGFTGEAFLFNSAEFDQWVFPVFGKSMLPGHCHFPLLRFFQCHPQTSALWFIEYDVRFTGEWSYFLDSFKDDDADLLCCHLRTPSEEPKWFWWNSLKIPADYRSLGSEGVDAQKLRSFLVISRYSAAAIETIIKAIMQGCIGHQEVIVPTVIASAGLKVRDLNGVGINCPSRVGAQRFYTSYSDLEGSMQEFGTVRYRPPSKSVGRVPNTLYHPVKPSSMTPPKRSLNKLKAVVRLLRAMWYRW